MNGPNWNPKLEAEYDKWKTTPDFEDTDLTPREIEAMEIAAEEDKFERMRDLGII
jgi:hypothetical protein